MGAYTGMIEKKFLKYHRDNPHVYVLLIKFARQARAAGYEHYSLGAIVNQVRWHVDIVTKDPEGFKINNNYASYYSRMIMAENPGLKGFFRVRESQ